MAGPHGMDRVREMERADTERLRRLEKLTRDGWSFRYDGSADEFVLAKHEVRGRTLAEVIDAAEADG